MNSDAHQLNPADPGNWPYGLPIDPKYLYPSSSGFDSYTGQGLVEDQAFGGDSLNPLDELGLEDLMAQRGGLIDSRVEMIMADIRQRRQILDQSLYQINLDQCTNRNMALLRGEDIWDKYRFKLEENILDLETEKRREEASYFKDVLFLKRDLRDSLIEKMEEDQKASLLRN